MPLANTNWQSLEAYLNSQLTNQQIEKMGYPALWYASTVCPNRMVDKRNHNVNCTLCDGTGFLYSSTGVEIKALCTSISMSQIWSTDGRFDAGTLLISTLASVGVSWWDRIKFNKDTIRYSEILQRGGSLIDKAKYTIVEIVQVVGSSGTTYVCGTDYSLSSDGKINWISTGSRPTAGAFYSVSYKCNPQYVIVEMMHQFRSSPSRVGGVLAPAAFPIHAVAKLDFLIGDESRTT